MESIIKKVCFQFKSDQMTVHFIVCLSKKMIKEFIFKKKNKTDFKKSNFVD